jgi:hypothetical protein
MERRRGGLALERSHLLCGARVSLQALVNGRRAQKTSSKPARYFYFCATKTTSNFLLEKMKLLAEGRGGPYLGCGGKRSLTLATPASISAYHKSSIT